MSPEPGGVSDLLRAWGKGGARADQDRVLLVYRELRRRAGENHVAKPGPVLRVAAQ